MSDKRCFYLFNGIAHQIGEAKSCVRSLDHDGHHWTTNRKPTKLDLEWLVALEGVVVLGIIKGDRRAFNRLRDKGLLNAHYRRDRTVASGYTFKIKASTRGKALLAGVDVR